MVHQQVEYVLPSQHLEIKSIRLVTSKMVMTIKFIILNLKNPDTKKYISDDYIYTILENARIFRMTKSSSVMIFQHWVKSWVHVHMYICTCTHGQACDSSLEMKRILCILIVQTNSEIHPPGSMCCTLSRLQILAQKSCPSRTDLKIAMLELNSYLSWRVTLLVRISYFKSICGCMKFSLAWHITMHTVSVK